MLKMKEIDEKIMESLNAGDKDKDKVMELVKRNIKSISAGMAIGLIGYGFWKVIGISKHDLGI